MAEPAEEHNLDHRPNTLFLNAHDEALVDLHHASVIADGDVIPFGSSGLILLHKPEFQRLLNNGTTSKAGRQASLWRQKI